ncbi:GGDEF domain-containing protein [Leptospira bandrabouensis]|uniref:diguanylate cyclase n=2 Tax=Leptospira bandrabouensis TaxID=2484903 RepID=A0A6H3NS36_9LEPT|nr:GGDEF domain-containing protein [Leptospira bandrabouensis]TGN12459.1 GGDEF domain-containing protein [Leptospira bandrabouensis]
MRRHTFKRYFFVFRKMFLRTYHPSFTATNISDIGSSLQIFSVMTAFTSIISLLFVDSLVRTKEASFWIAFFRISSLGICFFVYLFGKKRVKLFQRHIYGITSLVLIGLILLYIPMMVYDKPNHAYYLFGSAIVIASASILLWIEPFRILLLSTLYIAVFIPLHLNFSRIQGFDRFVFYQDVLIVSFLLAFGFVANLLINYWRFEEYRVKARLRVTVGKLLRINQKIEDLSRVDSMTELFNRRHLLEQFDLYKKRSNREGFIIGLVILDLDRLKAINDKYGHKQGDLAIQAFAKTVKSRTRITDIAARIGGDEFCLLVSPIDKEGLQVLAESIREKLERLQIPIHNQPGESLTLTVSIGATLFRPEDDPSFDELYHKIDTALYTSKNEGRNRITLFES